MFRFAVGFLLFAATLQCANGPANADAVLPDNSFWDGAWPQETFPIPGGMGVEYFYGEWRTDAGGGPITITPSQLLHLQSDNPHKARDYRVLFEGRDYVLIVNKMGFSDGDIWTEFGAFVLTDREQTTPGFVNDMNLWFAYCADADMKTAEAFDWSDERLIEEFLGQCGAVRTPGKDQILFSDGWGATRYIREMPIYGYPE